MPLRAIVAVRSMRNATRLWIDDGSVELDRRPLHIWRTLLPQASFPSIHRTAIVNLSHVAALDKHAGAGFHWQLRLRGVAEPWPVSRPHHRDADRPTGMVKTYCASGADRASRTCSTNKDTTRGTCGV